MKLWIVKHQADTDETRPAVYFSRAEAEAHAAQFLPGVARVVELDDAALVRAQALDEAARVCDVTPPYPFRPSIEAAHAIRALKDKP